MLYSIKGNSGAALAIARKWASNPSWGGLLQQGTTTKAPSAPELADTGSLLDFGTGYAQINSSVFGLELSGSGVAASIYTASLSSTDDNYITKVFGTDPQTTNTNVYVYKNFKKFQSSNGFDANVSMSIVSASTSNGEDFTTDYAEASSPTFVSQLSGGKRKSRKNKKHSRKFSKKQIGGKKKGIIETKKDNLNLIALEEVSSPTPKL